jgi:4-amino-4-deoxy-L-arabinose transferase-like glycosyltransferase
MVDGPLAAAPVMPSPPAQGGTDNRRFLLIALGLCLVGWALREMYLLGAVVAQPISGDSLEYWRYAWNLVHHGVFSLQAPSPQPPVPDAWRGPGLPVLLAWCLHQGEDGALLRAQQWLVLMGTALVPLTIALGRAWLSRPLALAAGAIVAVWPHLVVFSTVTMSETPFAMTLLATSLALAQAGRRASIGLASMAGVFAGLAVLVNPVFELFPFVLAVLLLLRGKGRIALAYLLAFALVAGAWSLRNTRMPPGHDAAERVRTNLVQGSWPLFHAAWNNRDTEPMAARYMQAIDAEITRMRAAPRAALHDMGARFASEPGAYACWYLLEKPYLLWDWSIRIGPGDIYMFRTERSPFERVPVLHGLKVLARVVNPFLFALALLAACVALFRGLRLRGRVEDGDAVLLQMGLLFFYLTAVHVVLQAEPRYSIPYRPFEMLLAVTATGWLAARLKPGRVAA